MLSPEQNRLVEQNIGLVGSLVKTHTPPPPWSREDLMSAGYEALCGAALRWQPSQGSSFSSYAYRRINGAFLDELRILRYGPRHNKMVRPNERITESHEAAAPDEFSLVDLNDLLSRLPVRERTMVRLRSEGMSSSEIAKIFGLHFTRVSQILTDVERLVRA